MEEPGFYGLESAAIKMAMKRAAFKIHPAKGGWIRTTIAPIGDKQMLTFGPLDLVLLTTLVAAVVAVARVLIAH